MSDYLGNLVARSLNLAEMAPEMVRPRPRALFEPQPAAAWPGVVHPFGVKPAADAENAEDAELATFDVPSTARRPAPRGHEGFLPTPRRPAGDSTAEGVEVGPGEGPGGRPSSASPRPAEGAGHRGAAQTRAVRSSLEPAEPPPRGERAARDLVPPPSSGSDLPVSKSPTPHPAPATIDSRPPPVVEPATAPGEERSAAASAPPRPAPRSRRAPQPETGRDETSPATSLPRSSAEPAEESRTQLAPVVHRQQIVVERTVPPVYPPQSGRGHVESEATSPRPPDETEREEGVAQPSRDVFVEPPPGPPAEAPVVVQPRVTPTREVGAAERGSRRTRAGPEPGPTVQVTIGRVEVRATPPPPAARARKRPEPVVMSLDEYLRRRVNGGQGGQGGQR